MPTCTTTGTQIDATKVLANDIRAKLKGDYPVTKTGLAVGSTATDVASAALDFTIAGVRYSKAAVAAGTAPGTDVVPEDLFGAIALDIGTNGTIDIVEAPANATGYASSALAVADLPAQETLHARLGTVSVSGSEADFTFGTTDLDAANTTVVFTDGETNLEAIGDAVTAT